MSTDTDQIYVNQQYQKAYNSQNQQYSQPTPSSANGYPQQIQMIPSHPIEHSAGISFPPQTTNITSQSLSLIDQIFGPNSKAKVKQRIEPFELLTGFETENKYDINFENGYLAVALEESDCCARQYCGPKRPFKMHIALKQNKQEFLTLERPYCHFLHEVNVYDTIASKLLGQVELRFTLFSRELNVFNSEGEKMFDIVSPCCECWTFHIEKDGERVGSISKKWSGFVKEAFTDADNFGIHFPERSTPIQKAVLLGALFLIDFLYFETNEDSNKNDHYY